MKFETTVNFTKIYISKFNILITKFQKFKWQEYVKRFEKKYIIKIVKICFVVYSHYKFYSNTFSFFYN